MLDEDDIEGVTVVEQIINGPFQSKLASLREVQGHPNIPIFSHVRWSLPSLEFSQKRNGNARIIIMKLEKMAQVWSRWNYQKKKKMVLCWSLNISWASFQQLRDCFAVMYITCIVKLIQAFFHARIRHIHPCWSVFLLIS